MNPQQPPQPPSDKPVSPPVAPPVPSTAPPPVIPPAPPHGKNNIPLVMVAVLFVLIILGGIAAVMFRPQSPGDDEISVTPTVEPTEIPTPTIEPTKTPPEKEIDTIDIGSDEASFNDIQQDLNKL